MSESILARNPDDGEAGVTPEMADGTAHEVTRLLDAWSSGDAGALDALLPLVMGDLRRLAGIYMSRESSGHTLQPTALVHEAYLRLVGRRTVRIASRIQLFAVLAETMRRILVDHGRRKKTMRHGGGMRPVSLDEICGVSERVDIDIVALDDALRDLEALAPRQCRVVKLNYFAGLSQEEIAPLLEVSPVTVKRDLKAARIWLLHELRRTGAADGVAEDPGEAAG